MQKKVLSAVLAFTLLLSLLTPAVFAALPAAGISASKTEIMAGDTFTVSLAIPAIAQKPYNASFKLQFDKEALEVTSFTAPSIPQGTVSGASAPAEANAAGEVSCTYDGQGYDNVMELTQGLTITVTFAAKSTAAPGAYDIVVDADNTYAYFYDEENFEDISLFEVPAGLKTTVTVIGKITGSIALGAVPAPVKKGVPADAASVTAPANVTVSSLTWDPAVIGTFTGETVYTAILNVKANTGYVFADGVTFTVGGESWTAEKQSDGSYNLTKTFPATAGKEAPVAIAPAAVNASYGQKLSAIALSNPAGNTPGTWAWAAPDTLVGDVGTRTFKAVFTPANTADYLTAEADVEVTVNPKSVSIQIQEIADQEYTGTQIKPAVAVQGGGKMLDPDKDFTVEYGANVNVGANAGSVTVKEKPGSNYTFTPATKQFNIVPKAGTLTISGDLNVTYGTAVPDVTADKHGSDGAVTVYYYTNEACTEGETDVKPVNAGSYWVRAKMTAGTNFGSAVSNAIPFTIAKASVTAPAADPTAYVYNGTEHTYVIAPSDLYEVADNSNKAQNAGKYTVTVALKDKANYQWNDGSSEDKTYDFIIGKAAIVPGVTISGWTYGYTAAVPEITGNTGNGAVTYEYKLLTDPDDKYTTTVPTAAGQYTLRATIAETDNYLGSSAAKADFTISRRNLSAAAIAAVENKTYTGSEIKPEPAVVLESITLVPGTDFTYSYENNVNAGTTASVKVTGIGNYTGETAAIFTIVRAKPSVTVNLPGWTVSGEANLPKLEGTMDAAAAVTYYYKPAAADDSAYTTEVPTAIGDYTVKAVIQETGNFEGFEVTANFAISAKAIQAITAENVTVTFGDTGKAVTASTNGNGTISYAVKAGSENIVSVDAATGALTIKNAGTATITVTASETASHAKAETDILVTVTPKQIPIPAADTTVYTYNKQEQTYKIPANDAYTVTGNKLTNASSSTVTVSLVNKTNYQWSDGSVEDRTYTFTVQKAKITVPAADTTVYTYNGQAQTYKVAANEAYTVDGAVQTAANEAGYTVTVTLGDTANYQWNDGTAAAKTYTFIIKKATITITAGNKEARTGDSTPELGTSDYTVTGLASGEALKKQPAIAYETAPDMKSTGTYKILVSGAEAPDGGNYNDIVYKSGTLTVSQKFIYIPFAYKIVVPEFVGGTVTADKVNQVDGKPVQLTVTPDEGYALESLKVVTAYGREVALTAAGSVYTFRMPMDKVTVTATFKKIAAPVIPEVPAVPAVCAKDGTCPLHVFTDLDKGAWYHDGIHFCVEKGMMNGMSKTAFEPGTTMNRAMILTILWRLEGEPVVKNGEKFTDVADGQWYSDAVAWGAANNIMGGYGDGVFGPADALTREQIATVMYRYAKYKGYDVTASAAITYPDADKVSDWAETAVQWACSVGLIGDAGEGKLDPAGSATRAQAATILMRFIENIK